MEQTCEIKFRKMNGLGNDFIILDGRIHPCALSLETIIALTNRETGIGADQLIILEPSSRADLFMRIYNADGGEVEACGNVTRCVADILMQENGTKGAVIETGAGLLNCTRSEDGLISVDMGEPNFAWDAIPLSEEFADTRKIELQIGPIDEPILHSPSVVNVGNPHCVFWVDDITAYDLSGFGPLLENHPLFPQRANISLAHVADRGQINLSVWERGAGITQACGTAACAVAVCAMRKNLTGRDVTVTLPGGDLQIEWRDNNHIIMTGPVTYEFDGLIDLDNLAWKKAS